MKPLNDYQIGTLSRPPIELIIAQVRFPLVADLLDPAGIAAFQGAMRRDYPLLNREDQIELQFGRADEPRTARSFLWKFEDLSRTWTVTLAPDFLAIEVKNYQSFGELSKRLQDAFARLCEKHDITARTRLGLRYMDRISTKKYPRLPNDWHRLVAPELIPLAARLPADQMRSAVEHRYVGDGHAATIKAAFSRNIDTNDPLFVLDVDAFDPEISESVDLQATLDTLKPLCNQVFAWAFEKMLEKRDEYFV